MRCKGCRLSGPTPFFDNAPGSLLRNALVSPERAQGHATVVDHSREVPSQKRDLFENCFRPRRARPARYLVISVALVAYGPVSESAVARPERALTAPPDHQ